MKSQIQKTQLHRQNPKPNQHIQRQFDVDKETFYNSMLPVLAEMLQKDSVLCEKAFVHTSQHETNTPRFSQTFEEFLKNDAYGAFLHREMLLSLTRG